MTGYRNSLIATVLIGLLGLSQDANAAGTDKDFDMACAVTSAAEVATTQPGSEARAAALLVNYYFLGRLSGRDGKTLWSAVVTGRLAELRERSKSPEMYGKCLDFLTNFLTNKL